MTVRADTYAFSRQAPYLLERGVTQTIDAPIRHGSSGSLQAPASGTVTVEKPGGTDHTTAQAVTVTSSIATYSLTLASTETLGEGWTVIWALTMADGNVHTYRQAAYLCEYVPYCVISAVDLYAVVPDLRTRIPQYQQDSPRGDGTGWQTQIDLAYYDLIRHLLRDGRKPWLIREITGYREWLLHRALMHCLGTVSYGPDSSWAIHRKDAYHEWRRAEAQMRLQFSEDDADTRRGGAPVIRLAPAGRPRW